MSLPVILRPVAAMEFAEAMAWYRMQKPGLELEFKDCVDELLNRIVAHPSGFIQPAARFVAVWCADFLTPFIFFRNKTPSWFSRSSTPNATPARLKHADNAGCPGRTAPPACRVVVFGYDGSPIAHRIAAQKI